MRITADNWAEAALDCAICKTKDHLTLISGIPEGMEESVYYLNCWNCHSSTLSYTKISKAVKKWNELNATAKGEK